MISIVKNAGIFFFLLVSSFSFASKNSLHHLLPAYDAELTNFTYPFPVKIHTIQSQRQTLKMAYMDIHAKIPNEKTIVLMHGKNFSGYYWETTIELLQKQGFRVVVPDQIGFGKSSKPQQYQFTFQTLAANTRDLLDALKIKNVAVIGHSMGGMLATRFALMYPEMVDRLVLINPIGLEDWKTKIAYKTIDELYQQELKATPETIKSYQQKVYFDGEWKPEYDALIDVASGWTRHKDYPQIAWNAALTTDMVFTQPVLYEFPQIKAKTLLIIGTRDRTAVGKAWATKEIAATLGDYSILGKKTADLIPDSTLVEIPDVGHVPQVEAFPIYKKALLDFLK